MSLKTWKEEYYPTLSSSVTNDKEAILHSIKKWTGLLAENLQRHNVHIHEHKHVLSVSDDTDITEHLYIDAYSCALCHIHIIGSGTCHECPLRMHLGLRCDYYDTSPFQVFEKTKNPEPMLTALLDTLKEFEVGDLNDKEV